jgi:uncharacterized membrane protein YfcA
LEHLSVLQLAFCAAVLVIAYGVRGITGFGSGALAIPLLALALPLRVIVPVITLLGFFASISHIVQDRSRIAWGELLRLLPFTALGVAAGLYLFVSLSPETLRNLLGGFVIVYALFSLREGGFGRFEQRLAPLVLAPAGALAGLVATLFGGMSGPIYVVYLRMRRLGKAEFRVTIATILFVLALIRIAGYAGVGVFDRAALLAFATAVPAMALGTFVGNRMHARVSERAFSRFVAALLVVSGAALILK